MALREILKNDTSAETQAALAAAHNIEAEQPDKIIGDKSNNEN